MIPEVSLIPFELGIRALVICKYLAYNCQPIYRFAWTPQLYTLFRFYFFPIFFLAVFSTNN